MSAPADGPKNATPITQARNRALLEALPFDDTQDFEDARRGLLGTWPEAEIRNEQGRIIWSPRLPAEQLERRPDRCPASDVRARLPGGVPGVRGLRRGLLRGRHPIALVRGQEREPPAPGTP